MQASDYPTDRHTIANGKEFESQMHVVRQRIYNVAYRILRNRDDAEDITQETFVRAWANINRFVAGCSFEAWVTRIATNLCLDTARRRQRQRIHSLEAAPAWSSEIEPEAHQVADSRQDPAVRLLDGEVDESLLRAVRALPAHYRGCIQLLEQDYSYGQISTLMGCPVGTIRSRLYRARMLIRKQLETDSLLNDCAR